MTLQNSNNKVTNKERVKNTQKGGNENKKRKRRKEIIGQRYMNVKEVAKALQIAESTAYAVIRGWNKELEKMGYFTKAGSIPTAFFKKKCYGFDSEQGEKQNHQGCPVQGNALILEHRQISVCVRCEKIAEARR